MHDGGLASGDGSVAAGCGGGGCFGRDLVDYVAGGIGCCADGGFVGG